jgi:hypothetical protein
MSMRLGLALSGGGFRATLFHLGVVRYLHEAGLLPQVRHVASVSGGSFLAAQLLRRWSAFTDPSGFEDAARELVDFIQLDVRGRIVATDRLYFERFEDYVGDIHLLCDQEAFAGTFPSVCRAGTGKACVDEPTEEAQASDGGAADPSLRTSPADG